METNHPAHKIDLKKITAYAISSAAFLLIISIPITLSFFHLSSPETDAIQEPENATEEATEPEPEPEPMFHGREPNCPDKYCISVTINGDLLFHPSLWRHFTSAEQGFDFTPLFSAMAQYYERTDLPICNFETPIAPPEGPFTGFPIFSIPPQVADAVAAIGYQACTTATNHSFDMGAPGIQRLADKLDSLGIPHTGSYRTEAESLEPLIVEVEGGKVAIVGGTVSTNGIRLQHDWQVDQMRDGPMRAHDFARIVSRAERARELGADIVLLYLHSVQEYISHADSWQKSIAHDMANTGLFDLIYFHGSHAVQPIEIINNIYVLYGIGNAVTVSADNNPTPLVNNQGLTARAQFTSPDGETWRLNRLSYLPTFNKTGSRYAWCPLATDRPSGFCVSESVDNHMFTRMRNILYSMNVPDDDPILVPWLISNERSDNP